jgi:hypothetical protein
MVMRKNAKVLLVVFLAAVIMVLLFGWVLPAALQTLMFNHFIRGLVLALVFIVLVLKKRFNWSNHLVYVIAVFALIGMVWDTAGNPVYNKPLQWIASPFGELQVTQEVDNYAPGQYVISGDMMLVKEGGETVKLSPVLLHLYRLAQYMLTFSIIGSLLGPFTKRLPDQWSRQPDPADEALPAELEHKVAVELKRREEEGNKRRQLPEDIQASVWELKQKGELIRAIKIVRQHTDLSLGEAKKMVEDMEK